MDERIKLILSLSLSGTILAVLLFAARPFAKNKLSKTFQYYIWLLVILRLIVPVSFEKSIMNQMFYTNSSEVYTSAASNNNGIQTAAKKVTEPAKSTVSQTVTARKTVSINSPIIKKAVAVFKNSILYIWLFGMIAVMLMNILGYLQFIRYIKITNKPAQDNDNKVFLKLLRATEKVRLVRNEYVKTPMLVGIFKPCIIIPDNEFTDIQLENIFLHELTHMRRLDLLIKWITAAATAVHWFNPAVYLIKRHMNHACELSCDEGVIKNLNDDQKQEYGDTLISVVSDCKYPVGAISTTMCEEKRTLKERLVSIMLHSRKSKLVTAVSAVLFLTAAGFGVALGAGVGNSLKKPPDIYVSSEFDKTKDAVMGGYKWKNGSENIVADSSHPANFNYKTGNILTVSAQEQIIISTQKLKSDKKYSFSLDKLEIYKDGKLYNGKMVEPSFLNGNLYTQAPKEPGEYVYSVDLSYGKKGSCNYGFVVRAGMKSYNLSKIMDYKTKYIGNHVKTGNIASLLPVPDKAFIQRYISMKTKNKPYKLTVYYEAASSSENTLNVDYNSSEFKTVLQNNALVVFCMIENADEVTFTFRNSPSNGELETEKYDKSFSFTKDKIKSIYSDFDALSNDIELLDKLLNK